MSKITEYFGAGIGFLFYILFSYGEIAGIMHSAAKHGGGDLVASIILPPWAWYRSAEMWWHNDSPKEHADVNWDKKLQTDIKSCLYFVNESANKDADTYKINEDVEEFSSKVRKYPNDKKQFLMTGCRKYIDYLKSGMNDATAEMQHYYLSGNFSFKFSPATKKMESELIENYNLRDELELQEKFMEEQAKQINQQPKENSPKEHSDEDKTKFEYSLNLLKVKYNSDYRRIFKQIFDEEL